ncbi:sterol homeostasis protein [Tilletia horrida]|uniref:Protein ARV n=1 Tax=Tilletia horrida TaxID=155126 RepID=A0AAN6GSD8_9BASI|nr:sterol homeostasis protein [Tilletia horrida]KAK0551314.1 sterol homeostasis protein [Tilletia horrida]
MTCLCVRCGAVQPHLYLRYPHGSVLSVPCEACSSPTTTTPSSSVNHKQAADPYVENDGLVVFLDLILVKPRAFRHLLFNRPVLEYEKHSSNNPRLAAAAAAAAKKDADGIQFCPSLAVPDSAAWLRAVRSFMAVQLVDSFLRWYYLCAHLPTTFLNSSQRPYNPHPLFESWVKGFDSRDILHSYLLVVAAVTTEALTLLITVTSFLTILVALRTRFRRFLADSQDKAVTAAAPFKPYLVVNALLLANVSTLFLLSLVLLWQAGQDPNERTVAKAHHRHQPISTSFEIKLGLDSLADRLLDWQPDHVVRHLVAGLSSGVSLAVVLPRAPMMTTASILAGWAASALVRSFTLLPSSSGDGAALTAEGRFARPFFCPSELN